MTMDVLAFMRSNISHGYPFGPAIRSDNDTLPSRQAPVILKISTMCGELICARNVRKEKSNTLKVVEEVISLTEKDPIAEAMKPRLEEATQELVDELNKMIQVPVGYEFVEDEYHDPGEGPTYTLVCLTYHPDLPRPGREQVKAGQTIGQIKKLVEGLIEGMRVTVEYITIEEDDND